MFIKLMSQQPIGQNRISRKYVQTVAEEKQHETSNTRDANITSTSTSLTNNNNHNMSSIKPGSADSIEFNSQHFVAYRLLFRYTHNFEI
jgi:hypothetical protein